MTAGSRHGEAAGSALVGVDESLSARLALETAADRVGPSGRLVVAHAVDVVPGETLHGALPDGLLHDLADERREVARALVDRLAGDVATKADARVVEGPPAVALARLAAEEHVDEIVVGSRGLGRFVAALGSVSHGLLHEADRPVVVVPRNAADLRARRRPTGERIVVVGYDGSASARAALGRAAADAGPAGRIVAVHAYAPAPDWLGTPFYGRAVHAHQAHGRRLLEELEAAHGLDVELETSLLEGAPARALITAAEARDADEVVIGSRGRSALRGTLGSVSHALLHEADRPVVVIPARAVAEQQEVQR